MIRVHPARFLSRLLLGVAVSVTLLATGTPVRALTADGFTYTVSAGSATVTGCDGTCPWNVVIPATLGGSSVVGIGDYAFYSNLLASVTIPNSVTSIGYRALSVNRLASVTIPNSVTSIGEQAFYFNQLTSVTIPNSVTSIGNSAFGSNSLTSVTFDGNAPAAGSDVFYGNYGLAAVTRPWGATGWSSTWGGKAVVVASGFTYEITDGAATATGYFGTAPTALLIPATLGGYPVTTIAENAFARMSLTSVTIPESVTTIGAWAFAGNQLINITFPNSITTIGDLAFKNNRLTSINIPNALTSIGVGVFIGNELTSINIPNSVTSIGAGAFMRNRLASLVLADTVTSIGPDAFRENLLTSVMIPHSVTSIGGYAFFNNKLTRVTFIGNRPTAGGSVWDEVFGDNPGLNSIARFASATGWGATYSGKRVVIATRATATVKPTITGTAIIGRTMTAKTGTWRGTPAPTYRYQWYACTKAVTAAHSTVPSTCTVIAGATRSTFKLTSTQRSKYVAVLVTGTSLGTTATTWLSKTASKVR